MFDLNFANFYSYSLLFIFAYHEEFNEIFWLTEWNVISGSLARVVIQVIQKHNFIFWVIYLIYKVSRRINSCADVFYASPLV